MSDEPEFDGRASLPRAGAARMKARRLSTTSYAEAMNI